MQVETVVVRVTVAETVLVDVPGPIGMPSPANLPVAHRARSPMNEHAQLGIAEPLHAGIALLNGLVHLRHLAEINYLVLAALGLYKGPSQSSYGPNEKTLWLEETSI